MAFASPPLAGIRGVLLLSLTLFVSFAFVETWHRYQRSPVPCPEYPMSATCVTSAPLTCGTTAAEKGKDWEPQQWLFVLSTGRAGSTTILEMLNAVPLINMAGENDAFILRLFDALAFGMGAPTSSTAASDSDMQEDGRRRQMLGSFSVSKSLLWRGRPYGPWRRGPVRLHRVRSLMRAMMRELIGGSDAEDIDGLGSPRSPPVVGFKEVRFITLQALQLLHKVFPDGKFILNIRENITAQVASSWWRDDQQASRQILERANADMQKFRRILPEQQVFWMPLESFDVGRFHQLLQWIGIDGCTYSRVLQVNQKGKVDHRATDAIGTPGVTGECTFRGSSSG